MYAQIGEDVVDMVSLGGGAEVQFLGDLLVLQSSRHVMQDLGLPRRERGPTGHGSVDAMRRAGFLVWRHPRQKTREPALLCDRRQDVDEREEVGPRAGNPE